MGPLTMEKTQSSPETSKQSDDSEASTSQCSREEDEHLFHSFPEITSNTPTALDTSSTNFDASSDAAIPKNNLQSACNSKRESFHILIENDQTLTRDRMLEFLENREKLECVISISHPKVAQKSCASEKRFFCPPPCIYLSGQGWDIKKERIAQLNRTLEATTKSNFMTSDPAIDQTSTELAAYIGIGSDYSKEKHLNFSTKEVDYPVDQGQNTSLYDYCAAKELYISEAYKHEHFDLRFQLSYGCGMKIGPFISERIKVISEPLKHPNMMDTECKFLITSGSKVALFNRPTSQNKSTRYLHVKGNAYCGSSTEWGVFRIYLLDDEDGVEETDQFDVREGFVNYGSVVKLVDSVTGVSLPSLRIRKVEKQEVILDDPCNDEPVSQLHKCAFQTIDNEMFYLSLINDKVVQHQTTVIDESRHQITDESAWTIISAGNTEHRFYEAMGQVSNPISPCPVVGSIEVEGHGKESCVRITGRDFKSNLKVWFGSIPVETIFRSEEHLSCAVPPLQKVKKEPSHMMFINVTTGDTELPISLVREDGVIYSSGLTYTYKTLEWSR